MLSYLWKKETRPAAVRAHFDIWGRMWPPNCKWKCCCRVAGGKGDERTPRKDSESTGPLVSAAALRSPRASSASLLENRSLSTSKLSAGTGEVLTLLENEIENSGLDLKWSAVVQSRLHLQIQLHCKCKVHVNTPSATAVHISLMQRYKT